MRIFSCICSVIQAYFKFHGIAERKRFIYFITDVVWWKFNLTLHLAENGDELISYGRYH